MARSHARVKVSIHRDADWLARSPEAKLTYYTLLSDPRLTIAGVMELADRRWGRMTGYPLQVITAALSELEEHGYVVVDSTTDELLIRTLSKHDLDPNRINQNLAKGFWGAWGIIESAILRSVIVHELDDDLWERLVKHGPGDVEKTRRSARLEPERHYTVATAEPAPVAAPPSSHLSPTTSRQPAEQRRVVLEAAAELIGERAAARPSAENPTAVAKAVARGVVRDRYEDAYRLLAADPELTPQELADLLEPEHEPKPELVDGRLQAQQAMAERNHLRLAGEACSVCDAAGWYLDDTNTAVRCDCSQAQDGAA